MYCRQCGYTNDKYSKMCHRCGSLLKGGDQSFEPITTPSEDSAAEKGRLKYARKSESFIDIIKSPFRRLERASAGRGGRVLLYIAAGVFLVCLCAWIIITQVRASKAEVELIYGNTPGNISSGGCAVSDGRWLYYSLPTGDNPGLYRVSLETGDELKISYICISQMSVVGDWLYGVDQSGVALRISSDGTRTEEIIADDTVRCFNVINDDIYYIGMDDMIYHADVSDLSRKGYVRPRQICYTPASALYACNGYLYYSTLETTTVSVGSVYSDYDYGDGYTGDGTEGVEITDIFETEPTRQLLITTSGGDIPIGSIRRMDFDGGNDIDISTTPMCSMTVHGEYIYCQTEQEREISASVIDPKAPESMTVTVTGMQCWRINLTTGRLTKYIDGGIVASPINATDSAIYFLGEDGNLMTAELSGENVRVVLTGFGEIESFAIAGSYIYYTSDGGMSVGRVKTDGSDKEILCRYVPVEQTEEDIVG